MAAAALDASLILILAAATVSDLRTRLVPDGAVAAGLASALAVLALLDPGELPERLLAGLGAAGFLLAAAVIRPEGMGLGDVKLAGVLGVYLGPAVIVALIVACVAGSVAGLVILVRHGWGARGRAIPFVPFLAAGALVALTTQP